MENKDLEYKVIEGNKLGELLEMKLIVERLGLDSFISRYKKTLEGTKILVYAQDELDRYHGFSDMLRETLDAENVADVSDEEKEDMLYTDEFDSCGCGCYFDDYDEEDDEEVEGTYTIVYLEEEDDDYDEDDWADEFDDFYSESFENSIFKEMEDFVNGKHISSTEEEEEEEEDTPDQFIVNPELLYQILIDYIKKILE